MKRKLLAFFLLLSLVCLLPVTALANSAEPPGLIILVSNGPEDLQITMEFAAGEDPGHFHVTTIKKIGEYQYRLFYPIGYRDGDSVLHFSGGGKSFSFPVERQLMQRYNTVLTLDFEKQTLTPGQSPLRQPLLVAARIVLTLLLEGAVLLLWGFRKKQSWAVFLLVNLLTQGMLNAIIVSNAFSGGYWMILYYLAEVAILIGESIAFGLTFQEQKPWRRVLFAITANIASLLFGGLLLNYLPI